jgi:lysozyme
MSAPVCIDISHHQGFPDFKQVAASGVLGMIHKATEGQGFVDQNRATNCTKAIAAGLKVSTYHWLSPGSSPSAQMEFYLDTVKPVRGERVVIDYEQNGCKLHELQEAVLALKNTNLDLQITVYSGHLLKEQLAGGKVDPLLKSSTDLWLAEYQSPGTLDDITWPTGTYPKWTLHQYSETGSLPGIEGSLVDFDRFNGTNDEFLKWISPAGGVQKPSTPTSTPDQQVVTIDVIAPPGVRVITKVNDHAT